MFKWNKIEVVGIVLYYECFKNCHYHSISVISFKTKINGDEFENIIKEFNGREVWDRYVRGEIIKFNNEKDVEKCCEYLNSLLILNKIVGD